MICFDQQFLFIITIPPWFIFRLVRYFLRSRRKEQFNLRRELFVNALFLYCLAVTAVTFFPLFIGDTGVMELTVSVNYIPVMNTLDELRAIENSDIPDFMLNFWIGNIGGNLLLLMPMGVFLPVLREKFRSVKAMALTGLLISFAIEVLQLLSVFIGNFGRVFDVDDMILNTFGAIIGYGVFCLISKLLKGKRIVQEEHFNNENEQGIKKEL